MRGLAKARPSHGNMELQQRSRPTPGPSEALVEVEYAGLCGSDGGIFAYEEAFERMELPTVIGHEYTGQIVDTGGDVDSFAVGDRVVERPIRGCGNCYQCAIGEENVCQDAVITGVDHDGAYTQFIAVPERALHPVPASIDPQAAAIVEPTSIGARAVIQHSRVGPGDHVLVEGPGPIGLLTAQIARAQGGSVTVSGVDSDEAYRLALARDLGFETINVQSASLDDYVEEWTKGIGFDVVFDTTGHPSGLTTGVDAVRKGGQIVLIGQTGTTEMPYSPLVRAEIDLQCSYASMYEDFERAVVLLQSGVVDHETMIDDQYSLLDATPAFESFLAGETCKPVFDVTELHD